MNTYHPSYARRKAKREKVLAKMVQLRAAKERKRIERAAAEPIRKEWRGRLTTSITFHNRVTGIMHTLDLYRGRRRDRYRVTVDGKPWRELSATQLAGAIRRRLSVHVTR